MVRKSPTRTKNRRNRWYAVGVATLVIAVLGLVIFQGLRSHSRRVAQTGGQSVYNQNKKEAVIDNGGAPVRDNSKGSSQGGTYTPPATDNGITITPSKSGNQIVITTKLVGYSDGTCTLTVTNDSKSTTQNANVIYAPDFSACAGFSIPISTLGAGTWNITLSVVSGGNTTSKTATYEVSS